MAITRLNNNSITSITALPSGVSTGKILQIKHGVTYGVVSMKNNSFVSLVSVNITLKASNSDIYLFGKIGEPDQIDGRLQAHFRKNGTRLGANNDIICSEMGRNLNTGGDRHYPNVIGEYYETNVGTTSQVTYAIYWASNNAGAGTTTRLGNGSPHSITAYEIGA